MKLTMSNWVLLFFALCVIALNPAHAQTGATTAKSSEARSAAKIPIQQFKLKNGLRVVLSEDHSAPTYSICVTYDVGSRDETAGHTGFAHLFEHMMFQGSEHAGKMMHIKLINSSGGVLNGSTHYDVTNYYEAVPSNALDRVLWLEADRMRALKVDDENLRNQRDVVKEEVRVNVLNQPYGGFPWLDMPPIAFRNWPNAHNFYGDFADLDAANLGDVKQFFKTYYAPSNAVLLILGDVTPEAGLALARRHFENIPAGPSRPAADVTEAPFEGERRGEVEEKFGTLPGIAIGYRAPERRTPDWYALAMLDQALYGGRAGRLYRRLVLEQQIAVDTGGGIHYPVGDLFDYNGPTLLVSRLLYKPEFSAEQALAAHDVVLDEVRQHGIEREELEHLKVKFRSDYVSSLEGGHGIPRYGLMHYMACFTLFDGEPRLVNSILGGFMEVTPEQVRAAAEKYLDPKRRAIVIRRPVKKGAA
jgi:zinc protease